MTTKEIHTHEWLSECCEATAWGEVWEGDLVEVFGATGRCGACKDNAGFVCECHICIECGMVRRDESGEFDARVMGGMKCGACAYG